MYGLIHRRIRKRVPRDSVHSVEILLCRARIAEDEIGELKLTTSQKSVGPPTAIASDNFATTVTGENSPTTVASENSPTTSATSRKNSPTTSTTSHRNNRPRCSFCKRFGHVSDFCRNRDKSKSSNSSNSRDKVNRIRCYGCGKPDTIRSRCDTCNASTSTSTPASKEATFNSASVCENSGHPLVNISIMGRPGVAIVDTGATHSLASPALYRVLTDLGVEFHETERLVRLADGSRSWKTLLTAEVPVTIETRNVMCEFLVLPGAETRTLLGIEFLSMAGMVLDIAKGKWMFAELPGRCYDFVYTYTMHPDYAELMRADSSELSLRQDEVSKLAPEQRRTLNQFSSDRAPQFAHDGPATEFASHRIKVSPDQEPIASPPYRMSQNWREDPECDLGLAGVDMPKRSSGDVREYQLKDSEETRILNNLEPDEASRGRPWSDKRKTPPDHQVGDLVLLKTQGPIDAGRSPSAKYIPRRDGPYQIAKIVSPTAYEIKTAQPGNRVGRYRVSHLPPFSGQVEAPLRAKRKRGRPPRLWDSYPNREVAWLGYRGRM